MIQEKIRSAISNTSANFAELHEPIELLTLAALAGQHSYLVGPPGVAKSAVARAVASIMGGRFFGIQCNAQTVVEDLFGPLDVAAYRGKLTWSEALQARLAVEQSQLSAERKREYLAEIEGALAEGSQKLHATRNYLPEAEVVFLDEPDKASSVTYQALLLALNERRFNQGGEMRPLPLRTAIMAGNAMPDPIVAHAFADRIALRINVSKPLAADSFLRVIFGQVSAEPSGDRITLEEWEQATREIREMPIHETMGVVVKSLRQQLLTINVDVTPRRWKGTMMLARARAWLRGAKAADASDLSVAGNTLWDTVEAEEGVKKAVQFYCKSPARDAIDMVEQLRVELGKHRIGTTEYDRIFGELRTATKNLQGFSGKGDALADTTYEQAKKMLADETQKMVDRMKGI